jgi:hypothetical protein
MAVEEVVGNWYDEAYLPGVAALREPTWRRHTRAKTDADLLLYLYQQRRRLLVEDPRAGYRTATQAVRQRRIAGCGGAS